MTEDSVNNKIIKNENDDDDKKNTNENDINVIEGAVNPTEQGPEVQVVPDIQQSPQVYYQNLPGYNQNQPGYYQNQPGYYQEQNQYGYYQGPPASYPPGIIQNQGPYQGYNNQPYYQGYSGQLPYTGQPLDSNGQMQMQMQYNPQQPYSDQIPYPDGNVPFAAQAAAMPGSLEPSEPAPPPVVLYKPTEEQIQKLKIRLRSKYKATLPFDWLGQDSTEWYSSWLLTQKNFVAFRIFVTAYAYWSWCKFQDRFFSDTWNCDMERIMDVTIVIRFGFVWLAFYSVLLGVGGVTLMSLLKLLLPKDNFKKLSDFKVSRTYLSKWRSWAVMGMNYHYDVGTIMASMPLVLLLAIPNFFEVHLTPSVLPSITLPILVLTDYWLAKRVRFNGTYSRRYIFATIFCLCGFGIFWSSIHYYVIRMALAIYTKKSLFAVILPTILLSLGFLSVATVGTDALYNFTRFKAHYLLSNHFKALSPRDVDQISKENEEHYDKKNKAKQEIYLAQLEVLKAEMNALHPNIDFDPNENSHDYDRTESDPGSSTVEI